MTPPLWNAYDDRDPGPSDDGYDGIEKGLAIVQGCPPAEDLPADNVTPFLRPPSVRTNAAGKRRGLDPAFLEPASVVIAEGQRLEQEGIPYVVEDMIPAYGGLGMLVARAKVGKSSLGHQLAAAVAMGAPFLEKTTTARRVLIVAAEDPPNYTAWLARKLVVDDTQLTFFRQPLAFNTAGLQALTETIQDGGYGFVLVASWQAVIRGLLRDENDNAGAVAIVEHVKAATRTTAIPWLIDAHAGKNEDQDDDADPTLALRGASAAAGAADYLLSLRYGNGAFGTQRRLSGKGRFVNVPSMTIDYDPATGLYTALGDTKNVHRETTWRLLVTTGALDTTPRSITELARRSGLAGEADKVSGAKRKQIVAALIKREEVGRSEEIPKGGGPKTAFYRLLEVH
jgi:AAA domain